ncbi:MAG: hypothetical protein WD116_00115 [Chloroflexota bacterium]
MTSEHQFDVLLRRWLDEVAPPGQPDGLLESVVIATGQMQPRPAWLVRLRGEPMPEAGRSGLSRFAPVALAGTAVIVALMIGIGLFLRSPNIGPSPVPDQTHEAVPSATPTALLWTQASLKEDWPASVRPEPDRGAIVQPFVDTDTTQSDDPDYQDPAGDTGLPVVPWVDIRELWARGRGGVTIGLADNVPPAADPTEQWIAYGVVIDTDHDGVPDWRYGMDNMPVDATGERPHRAWITDLHTGRTESAAGCCVFVGKAFFDTSYPGEPPGQMTILEFGGGAVAGGGTRSPGQVHPFYVWASVIQDGRVVATDYAPDVGWLDPGSTPQAESSPEVDSSPDPTPRVENDPDVPGGRLWTVTVVNRSSTPATLVVAQTTENGSMGLVVIGIVTPSVVPPGATIDVTFLLPPDGGEGWWIYVNPGPNDGGLLAWSDVPLWGEIHIQADGNMGWLGCPCRP